MRLLLHVWDTLSWRICTTIEVHLIELFHESYAVPGTITGTTILAPYLWVKLLQIICPSRTCRFPGIISCMHPANGRWRYIVTSSLIGRVRTQNDPWISCSFWFAETTWQGMRIVDTVASATPARHIVPLEDFPEFWIHQNPWSRHSWHLKFEDLRD